MVRPPNFCTSAANGRSRASRNASTACLSAASSSRGCTRLVSLSASPANSIISFEPLFNCLSAAQASSLTEPAPKRDNSVSLAAPQVAPSSRLARMLLPVAPISSWHQVILALSAYTCPNWNRCSSSAIQSDSSCCLWLYFSIKFTMEFIFKFFCFYSKSKSLFSLYLYFLLFIFCIFLFLPYVLS